jgi:hypothetical protein
MAIHPVAVPGDDRYHGADQEYTAFKNTVGGTVEMNVDGSITPVKFRFTESTRRIALHRINVYGIGSSLGPHKFVGLAALTNGLTIKLHSGDDDSVILDYTADRTIKIDADWVLVYIRWTLDKAGSPPVMRVGDYVEITVNDNLSTITHFRAMAQGAPESDRHAIV